MRFWFKFYYFWNQTLYWLSFKDEKMEQNKKNNSQDLEWLNILLYQKVMQLFLLLSRWPLAVPTSLRVSRLSTGTLLTCDPFSTGTGGMSGFRLRWTHLLWLGYSLTAGMNWKCGRTTRISSPGSVSLWKCRLLTSVSGFRLFL